jgi:predicted RNase H-like HicB family nuclease
MLDLEEKTMLKVKVSVVVEPDGDGFHAYAPALRGLHVDGETEEQALDRAKEAILVYLRSIVIHGDALPVGPDFTVKKETIPVVPEGAFLRSVTVQWDCRSMSGSR